MAPKAQIALALTALLAMGQKAHAQKTASSTSLPVTITLPETAFTDRGESVISFFAQAIPAGKRLEVQHVSISVVAQNVTDEMPFTSCQIGGTTLDVNGNAQLTLHTIPLTARVSVTNGVAGFTGGQDLTWAVEAGPMRVVCSGGIRGVLMSGLQATVNGTLVSK